MTKEEEEFLRALTRRVVELERQMEILMSEPDTTIQDHIEQTAQRVFAELMRHLEVIVPDFSVAELRKAVEAVEYLPNPFAAEHPAAAAMDGHLKARIREIITEMLPESIYEGEEAVEPAPPDLSTLLRERLDGQR